jgi:hypothetical protein
MPTPNSANSIILSSRNVPGSSVVSVVDLLSHPGNVFFVHHSGTDAAGGGQEWRSPLATLDYAVGLCTANQGDVIYVLPGHNEGLGNTTIDIDVAGVSVIGLGRGAQVPRIDFDHASASIDIGASGVTVKNLRLLPSVTDVLVGIDVEAGVTDTLIEDVEALPGEDGAGVDDFALVIDIKAGCTRTTVRRLKVRQHASAAGYLAGVRLTGASDDCLIEDCDLVMAGAGLVAPINGLTTLSTNLRVLRCILVADAEPGIELLTGTTGVLQRNMIMTDLATIAAAIVSDGCAKFDNQYVEVGGESGAVIGTASVND